MSLDVMFNPKTIAFLGANSVSKTVGSGIAKNLLENIADRKVFLINPFEKEISGVSTFAKISDIDEDIDLAIIATPAKLVLDLVKECVSKKVKAIVIISAGFGEIGDDGLQAQNEIAKILKKEKIALLGPNCLGFLNLNIGLNASFAPATPKKGGMAIISQSGALIDAIIDDSLSQKRGFSKIISIGNEAGQDISDFIEYLGNDPETKTIGLYIEGMKDGKKFIKVCQKVSKLKPIIVLKAGKNEAGKNAAGAHTGSLAGDYKVFQAAFRKAGIREVQTLSELLLTGQMICQGKNFENKLAIITNGGGCGVMAADYCQESGILMAQLSNDLVNRISLSEKMHPAWSKSNPIDIIGDATSLRYKSALQICAQESDIGAILIIVTEQIMTDSLEIAKIIAELVQKYPQKLFLPCFLGGNIAKEAINYLEQRDIFNFLEIKRAVEIIKNLKQ